jgi:uncharacterized protein YeaO (DUF488 family)
MIEPCNPAGTCLNRPGQINKILWMNKAPQLLPPVSGIGLGGKVRSMAGTQVRVRRVYEQPERDDGDRVLVDRVWPRGLAKNKAALSEWCKDVAPSTELRKWYGHDPARFAEFARRYEAELADANRSAALRHLRDLANHGQLTLVTATKAVDISQAAVLADLLRR